MRIKTCHYGTFVDCCKIFLKEWSYFLRLNSLNKVKYPELFKNIYLLASKLLN